MLQSSYPLFHQDEFNAYWTGLNKLFFSEGRTTTTYFRHGQTGELTVTFFRVGEVEIKVRQHFGGDEFYRMVKPPVVRHDDSPLTLTRRWIQEIHKELAAAFDCAKIIAGVFERVEHPLFLDLAAIYTTNSHAINQEPAAPIPSEWQNNPE